jgi:uncharacterized repeat protein (TIGR02543 family)
MKRGKKLFAIILSLAVAVSMMPIFALTASAAGPVTCIGYKCTIGGDYVKSVKINGTPVESTDSFSGLTPGQTVTLTVEVGDKYKGHYAPDGAFAMTAGGNTDGCTLTGSNGVGTGTFTIPDKDFMIGVELRTLQYEVKYFADDYTTELGTFYYDYGTTVTVKNLQEFSPAPKKDGYVFDGWIDDENRKYLAGDTFTAEELYGVNGKDFRVQWKSMEPTHTVTAGSLNVRQNPGTDQPKIGGLTNGREVVVVAETGGWSKIIYGSGYGWVDSRYLKAIPKPGKPNPFVDIFETDFFYEAVIWAYYATPQVTNGMDDTHFGPMNTVTRAQAVTFLWRSEGCPEPTSKVNPFADVPKDQYYYKAVLWAVEKGITKGVSATEFAPDATLSTQHIVTFLYRTKNPGKDGWDGAAAKWAADANGRPFGVDITVNNWTPCPRCDVVVFIFRSGFSG